MECSKRICILTVVLTGTSTFLKFIPASNTDRPFSSPQIYTLLVTSCNAIIERKTNMRGLEINWIKKSNIVTIFASFQLRTKLITQTNIVINLYGLPTKSNQTL